jgi:hypothetical protein
MGYVTWENNGLLQNHKHVDDPDYRCGIGCCHVPYLQRFANAFGFTAFFILPIFASQTLTTYINSQIPTLEKQFGLSSYESGKCRYYYVVTLSDFGYPIHHMHICFLFSNVFNLFGISVFWRRCCFACSQYDIYTFLLHILYMVMLWHKNWKNTSYTKHNYLNRLLDKYR